MKKIITLLAALLVSTAAFADTYFNFTLPITIGFHEQDGVKGKKYDTYEFLYTPGVSAEVFNTFDGAFGMGIKGGLKWENSSSIQTDMYDGEITGGFFGWYVAPTLGWALGADSATKKKINIYPFIYERLTYSNPEVDAVSTGNGDFVVSNYKYGASFSWQWGQEMVQNGFEFGFDMDWDSFISEGGDELGKNGWGFDIWLAYKLSLKPF